MSIWRIRVHNIGSRGEHDMTVASGKDWIKRPAQFDTLDAAEEACRIIRALRSDSAFIDCAPYEF